jgi:hypothetical protein
LSGKEERWAVHGGFGGRGVGLRAGDVDAIAGCVPFGRERSSLPMRRVLVLRSLRSGIHLLRLFVKRLTLLTSDIFVRHAGRCDVCAMRPSVLSSSCCAVVNVA